MAVVKFRLTTDGCPLGGIGSVRVYRGEREVYKEIVYSVGDIVGILRYKDGDEYLVKIRMRIPYDAWYWLLKQVQDVGHTIEITHNGWGDDVPVVL